MRSVRVVGNPPCFDDPTGMGIAGEEMLVEAFVPEPPYEALYECILLRFAGQDVMPSNFGIALPPEDGVRGQLRAIVGDDHTRPTHRPTILRALLRQLSHRQ